MKKILLILIVSLTGIALYSQVPAPLLWLRSDSLGNNPNLWQDISEKQVINSNLEITDNIFIETTIASELQISNDANFLNFQENFQEEIMNFNPSLRVNGSSSIVIDSISTESDRITVMVVYQTNDSLQEQNVWQIGDSTTTGRAGQSTQKIYDNYGENPFRENNYTKTMICTQTQKIYKTETEKYNLKLGNTNELPFNGKISEILLFSGFRHESIIKTWESYLAIKYGVTLCERSYYNSLEDSIWNFWEAEKYSGQIIGIGRDNYFGLNQKQSKTENGTIVFGVKEKVEKNKNNISQITDLQFIILGIDTISMKEKSEIYLNNGFSLTKYGNFRIQKSGKQAIPTFIEIDCSDFEIEKELFLNLHLLINRSGEENFYSGNLDFYPPETIDTINKILKFKNIFWDTDHNGSDIFCLALLSPDSIMNYAILNDDNPDENVISFFEKFYLNNDNSENGIETQNFDNQDIVSKTKSATEQSENFNSIIILSPNPNNGNFQLKIQNEEKTNFTVTIFTIEGKEVLKRKLSGQSIYNEEFYLRNKGEYQVKIQNKNEEKTFKILIF